MTTMWARARHVGRYPVSLRSLAMLTVAASVMLVGCVSEAFESGPPIDLGSGTTTLSLWVSNQSRSDGDVNLTLLVDDAELFSDDFQVGDQHRWIAYDLSLPEGVHVVSVRLDDEPTSSGDWNVETTDGPSAYATLSYWGPGVEPGQESGLHFTVFDEPPGFD